MSLRTLADWLSYQESLHPNTIDLGLERLKKVLGRLAWDRPNCPVITVGGTNGKGSSVAMLDSILSAAGYRVGTFTSPHLIRYNERIKIAGEQVADGMLIAAFERIEVARGNISLTFFEFNTLAALLIFATAELDVIVLEVGLGGTLDAVNVVDADVALVCSVALDHCEWLGNDIESIGRWKAGIFRPQRQAIFGARAMPLSVASEAKRIGAELLQLGKDFDYEVSGDNWSWRFLDKNHTSVAEAALPFPALAGSVQFDNASAVLAILRSLPRLAITRQAIEYGLRNVHLDGRFQSKQMDGTEWIFDVAHNPAAAQTLHRNLATSAISGRTFAVMGVFADKDAATIIEIMRSAVDLWIAADVNGARALDPMLLAKKISSAGGVVMHVAESVQSACEFARSKVQQGDRIVVFGSFHTVGPALEWIDALDERSQAHTH